MVRHEIQLSKFSVTVLQVQAIHALRINPFHHVVSILSSRRRHFLGVSKNLHRIPLQMNVVTHLSHRQRYYDAQAGCLRRGWTRHLDAQGNMCLRGVKDLVIWYNSAHLLVLVGVGKHSLCLVEPVQLLFHDVTDWGSGWQWSPHLSKLSNEMLVNHGEDGLHISTSRTVAATTRYTHRAMLRSPLHWLCVPGSFIAVWQAKVWKLRETRVTS